MKLLMLKGLPASGKTTYAQQLEGWVNINKDDLRLELLGGMKWTPKKEKLIVSTRDFRIAQALDAGKNVVSSDTNFAPQHEARLRQIAKEHGAEFEIKFFEIDLQTAIARDLKRANSVGERVIRKMWQKYIRPTLKVENDPKLPACIIVDVDGTLAHMDGRRPYAWDRVEEDKVDEIVRLLLRIFIRGTAWHVFIFSGRDGSCYNSTAQWLQDKGIDYDELVLRPVSDRRPDTEVKRGMWAKHIKGKFCVKFVLDDRQSVVDMWRDMGLKVLQVADGDF